MYEEALKILNILNNKGYESYIVGGFVRDRLLDINSGDIDIITRAHPDDISNIFNVSIKDNYGSVKLIYNGYSYDLTTFRKEFDYVDNRRPSQIEYVDTLEEDLKRRDFTINSICIDKDGNYVDLLNGINDLNNRIIKVIGDPDKKIKEDALRILRAIRFMCLYNFKLDDELIKSIMDNKNLIHNISFDRIKKELNIIFNSPNIKLFFDTIKYFNLYEILHIEPKNDVIATNNYLSIWAQLNCSDKYNFSNEEIKCINAIKNVINMGINNYTVYKYGKKINEEANKILKTNIDINHIYDNLPIKSKNDIDITYEEILNIVQNKALINKIYIDLQNQILYNKLSNKKKDIISYIEGDYIE